MILSLIKESMHPIFQSNYSHPCFWNTNYSRVEDQLQPIVYVLLFSTDASDAVQRVNISQLKQRLDYPAPFKFPINFPKNTISGPRKSPCKN
jgi:hypothetical protein